MKKISVLSLVYNHENYLKDFFNGIINQSNFFELELIIGVDKSEDRSLEICYCYQKKYPENIVVLEHKTRVGMFQNFISTYARCKGEYIAICEGDDYWTDNNKISKQVKALENHPGSVLCFTDIAMFDEEENAFVKSWAILNKDIYYIDDLIKANIITTCTVVFKNLTPVEKLNSFAKLDMMDWPLHVLTLLNGYAICLHEKTAVYRQSLKSIYSKNSMFVHLEKKRLVYEYFVQESILISKRKLTYKGYYKNLYAIAIRSRPSDPLKRIYLKKIMFNYAKHRDLLMVVKAGIWLFK